MTLISEVLAELLGMFLADIRLTVAILALVAADGTAIGLHAVGPMAGGGILLAGCLVLLVASVAWAARRR